VALCLLEAVHHLIQTRPSPDLAVYSEERVAQLMESEGDSVDGVDLAYRNNVVVETAYPTCTDKFASVEAVALLQDFYHDAAPLVYAILTGPRPKWESMLRLAFLHCLLMAGDYRRGFLSFKAHWESFTMVTPGRVLDLIRHVYAQHPETIRQTMLEVEQVFRQPSLADDPVLAGWQRLSRHYEERVGYLMGRGVVLAPHRDEAQWQAMRQWIERQQAASPFVEKMFADWQFSEAMRTDPAFNTARIIVNLFYLLGASVGFTLLDKFTLCYAVSQMVTDHYACDPLVVLGQAAERMVARQTT
jgi:hypothetical protein